MNTTNKHKKNITNTNHRKTIRKSIIRSRSNKRNLRGGKTWASSTPVSLTYLGQSVPCDLCRQNLYTETTGTLGKSKMRSGFTSFFFGEIGEVLDTTSIITYFCKNCGLSKMIRNDENIQIISGQVLSAPPAAAAPAAAPATAPSSTAPATAPVDVATGAGAAAT